MPSLFEREREYVRKGMGESDREIEKRKLRPAHSHPPPILQKYRKGLPPAYIYIYIYIYILALLRWSAGSFDSP